MGIGKQFSRIEKRERDLQLTGAFRSEQRSKLMEIANSAPSIVALLRKSTSKLERCRFTAEKQKGRYVQER
jgi:hypothetical protein